MNRRVLLSLLAVVCCLRIGPAAAQPPAGDRPPPDLPHDRPPEADGFLDASGPPDGPPPGPPMRHGRGGPPEHEQHPVDRWLDFLREKNPEEFDRLQRLREEDPEAFREALRGRRDRLMERRPDPEMDRHEKAVEELLKRLRGAPEEVRSGIRADLREHLAALFDLREAERRRQTERMARRLESLQEMLEKRAASREEIIDRRLKELLSEDAVPAS